MVRDNKRLKNGVLNCCSFFALLAVLGFIARTPRVSNWLFPLQRIELNSTLSEDELDKENWPSTTSQAVLLIAEELTDDDKTAIGNLRQRDMIQFHHGLGTYIRNRFGLWGGNMKLLESSGAEHPDDASLVILEELNSYLAKTSN